MSKQCFQEPELFEAVEKLVGVNAVAATSTAQGANDASLKPLEGQVGHVFFLLYMLDPERFTVAIGDDECGCLASWFTFRR